MSEVPSPAELVAAQPQILQALNEPFDDRVSLSPYLNILAEGGAGKTTFIRALGHTLQRQGRDVYLANLSEEPGNTAPFEIHAAQPTDFTNFVASLRGVQLDQENNIINIYRLQDTIKSGRPMVFLFDDIGRLSYEAFKEWETYLLATFLPYRNLRMISTGFPLTRQIYNTPQVLYMLREVPLVEPVEGNPLTRQLVESSQTKDEALRRRVNYIGRLEQVEQTEAAIAHLRRLAVVPSFRIFDTHELLGMDFDEAQTTRSWLQEHKLIRWDSSQGAFIVDPPTIVLLT